MTTVVKPPKRKTLPVSEDVKKILHEAMPLIAETLSLPYVSERQAIEYIVRSHELIQSSQSEKAA